MNDSHDHGRPNISDDLNLLFDHLDEWRHFPGYQLERRADLFFSMFMKEVLEKSLGELELEPAFVPEFPLRQKGEYARSDQVDYLFLSRSGKDAYFVELKTTMRSLSFKQLKNMMSAREMGLEKKLVELRDIVLKADAPSRQKYFHLLKKLEGMGLLKTHSELNVQNIRSKNRKANERIEATEIKAKGVRVHIVYVLPKSEKDAVLAGFGGPKEGRNPSEKSLKGWEECRELVEDVRKFIGFREFADLIVEEGGGIRSRFAKSLDEWANVEAGDAQPR